MARRRARTRRGVPIPQTQTLTRSHSAPLPRGRRPYERRTSYLKVLAASRPSRVRKPRNVIDAGGLRQAYRAVGAQRRAGTKRRIATAILNTLSQSRSGPYTAKSLSRVSTHRPTVPAVLDPSQRSYRRTVQDDSPSAPPRTCKERPVDERKRVRSGGGRTSRPFIPWCDRRR